jgi:hypothetical protein
MHDAARRAMSSLWLDVRYALRMMVKDGSGRSTTELTTLKIVVLAPIPRASVIARTVVRPGAPGR